MIRTYNIGTGEIVDIGGPAPSILPVPVQITSLTFAQLMTGLVTEEWITEAEGDAWLDGNLPQPVLDLIDGFPVAQRFGVKARAKRFITADINDPLVVQMATLQDKVEELPAFFNTYGSV